jgi:hypothetical protein
MRLLSLEGAAKLLEHQNAHLYGASRTFMAAKEYLDSPLAEIPYDRVFFWHESFGRRRLRLLRKIERRANPDSGNPRQRRAG